MFGRFSLLGLCKWLWVAFGVLLLLECAGVDCVYVVVGVGCGCHWVCCEIVGFGVIALSC